MLLPVSCWAFPIFLHISDCCFIGRGWQGQCVVSNAQCIDYFVDHTYGHLLFKEDFTSNRIKVLCLRWQPLFYFLYHGSEAGYLPYHFRRCCYRYTRKKASKFIAFAYAVQTELQVEQKLEMLWKLHPKATHICYAYRLGSDQNRFRMVDDGEPSNTAGKPIYGQILNHDVTDVVVFVVRYYGGTKLGASGLIAAYKDAASEVLTLAAEKKKREMMHHFHNRLC